MRNITGRKCFRCLRQGYTLVELLGVVVLILIFSTILITSNRDATRSAQSVTMQQQKKELQTAFEGWIGTRPSLNAAILEWNAANHTQRLNFAKSMLSFGSRDTYTVNGSGQISTEASSALNKHFTVSWGTGSPPSVTSMLQQGPIVNEN